MVTRITGTLRKHNDDYNLSGYRGHETDQAQHCKEEGNTQNKNLIGTKIDSMLYSVFLLNLSCCLLVCCNRSVFCCIWDGITSIMGITGNGGSTQGAKDGEGGDKRT